MGAVAKQLRKLQEWFIGVAQYKELELLVRGLQQSHLLLDLTNSCETVCDHCYMEVVNPNSPEARFMDPELAIESVRLFQPHKRQRTLDPMYDVDLTGGDAFCHPDLVEIVKGIKKVDRNIHILIRTSGYPLEGKRGEKLLASLGKLLNKEDLISLPGEDDNHSFPLDEQIKIATRIQKWGFFYTFAYDRGIPQAVGYARNLPPQRVDCKALSACKLHELAQEYGILALEDWKNRDKYKLPLSRDVSIYLNHNGTFRYCCFAKNSGLLNFDDVRGLTRDEAIVKLALQYFRVKHLPDNLPAFFRKYDPHDEVPGPNNCARCSVIVNRLFSADDP